jgi:hypothetical protein
MPAMTFVLIAAPIAAVVVTSVWIFRATRNVGAHFSQFRGTHLPEGDRKDKEKGVPRDPH